MSCRLTHTEIDGMKAVVLENDLLRTGILPGRGSDIYEFYFKPAQTEFLLRLKKGIRNPVTHFSQIRDTSRQFEDYYYGGWQLCLPNSPAFTYRGAALGQHGEVALIPWSFEITEESTERLSVVCTADVLRLPLRVTRKFSLMRDQAVLSIHETVQNYGNSPLDIMWGQHIAFGGKFLENGLKLTIPATSVEAEPGIRENTIVERGSVFSWPHVRTGSGQTIDLSDIPAAGQVKCSELAYLGGYPAEARYTLASAEAGFRLEWDGRLFKTLWMWQERNAIQDFPWWGDCQTIALEPWTSRWTDNPQQAIENGDWLNIRAGEEISTQLKASAFVPS